MTDLVAVAPPAVRGLHAALQETAHLHGDRRSAALIPEQVTLPGHSVGDTRQALLAALTLHRLDLGARGLDLAPYLHDLGFRPTTPAATDH